MPFGRGFQADRHRRVMNDVVLRAMAAGRSGRRRGGGALRGPFAGRSENYGDAEFLDEQPHLTDFIPIRPGVVAAWWLAAAGVVAGLEYLYLQMPRLEEWTGGGGLEALDLALRGSLATWFSSLALALTALEFSLSNMSIERSFNSTSIAFSFLKFFNLLKPSVHRLLLLSCVAFRFFFLPLPLSLLGVKDVRRRRRTGQE